MAAIKALLPVEGATGNFFDTDILIANPNNAAAPRRHQHCGHPACRGGAVSLQHPSEHGGDHQRQRAIKTRFLCFRPIKLIVLTRGW